MFDQAHYQLLNTLQLSRDEVSELVKDSLSYVNLLNTDIDVMRYHLKCKALNEMEHSLTNVISNNKSEIVYKMLCYDCGFENTDIYHQFKKDLCKAYLKNIKRGHVLVDGTYATLFGNPLEMLKSSIGLFNGKSSLKPGTVHNIRYPYNSELLGSRSPHVTIGNILVTKNVANKEIDTYFNLTKNIICINSIDENILERLSGADFDSDSLLITDNELMISAAKKHYNLFKVPTRNINPPKSKRHYTYEQLADLDEKTSSNKIGEIVNLSQELNSLLWDIISKSGGTVENQYDSIKEIYYDVCQLDVLSNIEIDRAKREFSVNTARELNKMREKYENLLRCEDGRKSMPNFLGFIADTKGYRNDLKKDYKKYETTMDYLLESINGYRSSKTSKKNLIKLRDIFKPDNYDKSKVKYKQIEKILDMAKNTVAYNKSIYMNKSIEPEDKKTYREFARDNFLYEINRMKINENTMYKLLCVLDSYQDLSVRNYLFYILYEYENETLTDMLKKYNSFDVTLVTTEESIEKETINIYGKMHRKSRILQ